MREQTIFIEALEREDPAERAAFLDQTCAGDPALRERVEKLLRRHQQAGSFLEPPAGDPVRTGPFPPAPGEDATRREGPGTVIGPYKLVQEIDAGGMGTVYLAQQTEPVRRLVALKVIKPGMDSRQVIARFEAERQALALMDHPNIARVLDAGTTEGGRPYFVMELVRGVPITRYCDEHRLTPRQRLELFVPVCQAVQHAHQKGVIHRDLKPANILVASYDGRPVPKVIDFGIAKAAGQPLTEHTLVTGFGTVVGTLEYMSPEQAELNQLDIDTRSDVYSLGVVLYELLTGSTPLERKRLKQAAMLEVLRVIREEEPPKPSTRLSTDDELPSIAAARGLEPRKLSGLVRGELDWMVMKALEKERNRRYESANGFAADLLRYLADEPVLACPPSAGYRLRKFARRNRTALAVAGLALSFVVLLGAGGGRVAFDRATRRARVGADLDLALQRVELYLEQGKRADARAELDQAERIASEAVPDTARKERLAGLRGRLEAEEQDQQFIDGYEKIRLRVETQVDFVNSRFTREAVFPEIRELFRRYGVPFADMPPEEAASRIRNRPEPVRNQLVAALYSCGGRIPKEDTLTLPWLQTVLEASENDPWRVKIRKAIVARDWQAVEELVRGVDVATQPPGFLVQFAEVLPEERKEVRLDLGRRIQRAYPADLWANHDLATELVERGRHGEAIRYFTAALALRPESPAMYLNRGRCLDEMKETESAIADYERCLALAPHYFMASANLSIALQAQGRLQDALAVCDRAVRANPDRAGAWSNRANVLNKLGQYEKAIADCNRAIERDARLAVAWANRGTAYRALGRYDKAIDDCTKALQLDEKCARALAERGNSYLQRGEYPKALADCSHSIELHPTDAFTWYTRGAVYQALGDPESALANCAKAVDLAPGNPWTHGNLGDVLLNMGRAKEAADAYRKAIAIDKDVAEFHCGLAFALRNQGEFREALGGMRRGHELRSRRPDGSSPSAQWVRQCERLVELDEHLPDFLSGKRSPASPEERLELAELCVRIQRNRAAVRFYDEAFTPLSPRTAPLIGAHSYNAACAAALAGCGKGKDADQLDDKERAGLRRRALDWLRGNRESAERLLGRKPEMAPNLARALKHWLADPDLAGVRGPESLARFPEAERQAWQKLWKDISDLLKRAREMAAPDGKTGAK
jgi:tetratricopeptide (TPR) repeat protein